MADGGDRLDRALGRLRRRRSRVVGTLLAGRGLLALGFLLLLLVLARRWARAALGAEILPLPLPVAVALAAGLILLLPGLVAAGLRLARPGLPRIAREADRRLGLRDLLSSALEARGAAGPIPAALVRRGSQAAEGADPARVYPHRRSLARRLAPVPIVLAALYLLALPAGAGLVPLAAPGPGAGAVGDEGGGERGRDDPAAAPGGEAPEPGEEPGEDGPEDALAVRVVPSKEVFRSDEPVDLFVAARGVEPLARRHDAAVTLVLDGTPAPLPDRLAVGPGPEGAVLALDARLVPELRARLTPGRHRVAAVLDEGDSGWASEEAEFEIEGEDPSGGGGAAEEPEPRPEEGAEPPPEAPDVTERPRFVQPLFKEGETVRKKGWALVPDPEAPAGSPPRRVSLEEAADLAGRRPESPVPVEGQSPADREVVGRYFDLLREER